MPFITPERLIPEDFFGMTEDGRVIRVKDVNFKKDNLPIEFNEYYTNIGLTLEFLDMDNGAFTQSTYYEWVTRWDSNEDGYYFSPRHELYNLISFVSGIKDTPIIANQYTLVEALDGIDFKASVKVTGGDFNKYRFVEVEEF